MGAAKTEMKELPEAIQRALEKGQRVELIRAKDGTVQANTVSRKLLK